MGNNTPTRQNDSTEYKTVLSESDIKYYNSLTNKTEINKFDYDDIYFIIQEEKESLPPKNKIFDYKFNNNNLISFVEEKDIGINFRYLYSFSEISGKNKSHQLIEIKIPKGIKIHKMDEKYLVICAQCVDTYSTESNKFKKLITKYLISSINNHEFRNYELYNYLKLDFDQDDDFFKLILSHDFKCKEGDFSKKCIDGSFLFSYAMHETIHGLINNKSEIARQLLEKNKELLLDHIETMSYINYKGFDKYSQLKANFEYILNSLYVPYIKNFPKVLEKSEEDIIKFFPEKLLRTVNEIGAVFSGPFILKHYNNDSYNVKYIDLYCNEKQKKNIEATLSEIGVNHNLGYWYSHYWRDGYQVGWGNILFVKSFNEDIDPVTFINETCELNLDKVIYDGKKMYTLNDENHIKSRTGYINIQCIENVNKRLCTGSQQTKSKIIQNLIRRSLVTLENIVDYTKNGYTISNINELVQYILANLEK